jgi:HAD superfamily hydrolase (TIGR01450 family)
MSLPGTSPAEIRAAVAGLRGLLIDADGVLLMRGAAIPGSAEAIAELAARGIPYRVITNYSSRHRETMSARLAEAGIAIPADHIITAASAAADHVRARYPGQPVFALAAADGLREFVGVELLSGAQIDAGARAAAVVIGDAGDDLPFRDIDRAFGQIRDGAELLAMHRNPWWHTSRGITLDSGAIVAGLEYASGRRATVLGKPSPAIFRAGLSELAADLGARRLPAAVVGMVGDDLGADVLAARRVGMRGFLVLTGKHGLEDVERLRGGRGGTRPDAIVPSLADLVAALD